MKDIKITKENYRQLFECAGFEAVRECSAAYRKELTVYGGDAFIELNVFNDCKYDDFSITAAFGMSEEKWADLSDTNNSTAEIDRIFYPFLDKPLNWEKKWDFESVFERQYGVLEERTQFEARYGLYTHENPRVQAFSRLLFVMEELNKEYEGTEQSLCEVHIREGWISVDYFSSRADIVGVWVLNSSDAADLFLRDNEADLKTFFNI